MIKLRISDVCSCRQFLFLGYVLLFGQMSFWGLTVILSVVDSMVSLLTTGVTFKYFILTTLVSFCDMTYYPLPGYASVISKCITYVREFVTMLGCSFNNLWE